MISKILQILGLFWPRFYIGVLGIAFFIYVFPFIYFPYSIWTFISLFYLDFYFPFLLALFSILFHFFLFLFQFFFIPFPVLFNFVSILFFIRLRSLFGFLPNFYFLFTPFRDYCRNLENFRWFFGQIELLSLVQL